MFSNFDELSKLPGVKPEIVNAIKQESYLSKFVIRNTEVVGPKVGEDFTFRYRITNIEEIGRREGLAIFCSVQDVSPGKPA